MLHALFKTIACTLRLALFLVPVDVTGLNLPAHALSVAFPLPSTFLFSCRSVLRALLAPITCTHGILCTSLRLPPHYHYCLSPSAIDSFGTPHPHPECYSLNCVTIHHVVLLPTEAENLSSSTSRMCDHQLGRRFPVRSRPPLLRLPSHLRITVCSSLFIVFEHVHHNLRLTLFLPSSVTSPVHASLLRYTNSPTLAKSDLYIWLPLHFDVLLLLLFTLLCIAPMLQTAPSSASSLLPCPSKRHRRNLYTVEWTL